jgi:hypothetical protein
MVSPTFSSVTSTNNGLGKILRQAADADLRGHDFQHAALVLDAKGLTGNLHGHADFELFVRLHFLQIDMQVLVRDRVALNLLQKGKGFVRLVRPGQLNNQGAAADRLQQARELRTIDGQLLGAGVLPVENRGNAIDLAETA